MVPAYAIGAWLALTFSEHDIYFDSIKDCYEAFTIYSFLQLLLSYIGSESAVCDHYREKTEMPRTWMTGSLCCLPPFVLNKRFLRAQKQGCIQFVIAKPVMAVITLALDSQGLYEKDNWSAQYGFLWVQIFYNISYSWALYALMLFYNSTKKLLAPHKPIQKFLMVKFIVFMSFWQGFMISLLVSFGTVESPGTASRIQAFLICVEMAFAAMLHTRAFPANEYLSSTDTHTSSSGSVINNLGRSVNVQDVIHDAYNNFTTSYREYELQDKPPAEKDGEQKLDSVGCNPEHAGTSKKEHAAQSSLSEVNTVKKQNAGNHEGEESNKGLLVQVDDGNKSVLPSTEGSWPRGDSTASEHLDVSESLPSLTEENQAIHQAMPQESVSEVPNEESEGDCIKLIMG